MALTLTAQPPAWSSAHSDLIFTVKDDDKVSDDVTYPNFKFIADVFVGGPYGQVARIKIVPDPATGVGIFNLGMICRNYIPVDFNPVAVTLLGQQWFNYMSLRIEFGEEWDYTPTYDIIDTDFILFFNSYEDRQTVGTIGSIINKVGRAATNRPDKVQVLFNSPSLFIPFFPNDTTTIPIVIIPNGGGFSLTTSYTPAAAYMMAILNLCPQVINSIQPGTITLATTSYTVQIADRTFVVQIICESIFKVYPIHFMNQYGGFDTKLFTKLSRATVSINKSTYGKIPYTVASDGSVSFRSTNNVYNDQQPTYASLFQEKMSLNTDLLTDEEYVWLRELLVSPMIYLEDDTAIYPITITDTDYETKKVVNDDLTNLTMNIQFGNQLNAQYR